MMERKIVIRDDVPKHMEELKKWLDDTKDVRLEDMAGFFGRRIDGYEEHMSRWREAYRHMAALIPADAKTLLDLGCGTGLELDEILSARPDIVVVGVDLSEDMLAKLREKHPGVSAICADYFKYDFGENLFDAAVSFESIHHFKPEKKRLLFEKIYRAIKKGGQYIQADYIACCDEEEALLMEECEKRRRAQGIPEDMFIHFDTPLTAERETELMREAGFGRAELAACIEGAAFIVAKKCR